MNLRAARKILENLSREANAQKYLIYSGDPEVDALIFKNPFAFLLGVIADQMVKSKIAWSAPFILKERLGHLNPRIISRMSLKNLEHTIRHPNTLHRFPRTMAKYFKAASKRVVNEYGGDASKIWNDTDSAQKIQERLNEFSGISQKKSSMMIKMLIRDWGLKVTDLAKVDLPFDIHVRRVFLRTGIAKKDSVGEVRKAGRLLNPDYQAGFDDAIWLLGRDFCHSQRPDHDSCPFKDICPKLDVNIPGQ